MYCYPYLELANKFNSILTHYRPIVSHCHTYSHWSVSVFFSVTLSLSLSLSLLHSISL